MWVHVKVLGGECPCHVGIFARRLVGGRVAPNLPWFGPNFLSSRRQFCGCWVCFCFVNEIIVGEIFSSRPIFCRVSSSHGERFLFLSSFSTFGFCMAVVVCVKIAFRD